MTSVEFGELFGQVAPALANKAEEFRFYGYGSVSEQDLWKYCTEKLWRKKEISSMALHEIVDGILSVSPAKYMTHTQVEGFRQSANTSGFSGLDENEFRELLAPKGQSVKPESGNMSN